MNKSFFTGNVTRDLELKRMGNGDGVCNFSLGINKKYKKDDNWVEQTVYPNFDVWGQSAENFAKLVKKGEKVFVEAEYTQRKVGEGDEQKVFHGFRVLSWEFAGGGNKNGNGNGNKVEEKDEEVFAGNPGDSNVKRKGRGPAKPKVVAAVVEEESDEDSIPF